MNGWPISGQGPTVAVSGELAVPAGVHSFNPSIAVDTLGNAAITFDVSGNSQFPSTWRAVKCASEPAFQAPEVLVAGSASYTGPLPFDADYTGTGADPSAASIFYGHGAIAKGTVSPAEQWESRAIKYLVSCGLDVNGDGVTDGGDMLAFGTLWQQGSSQADYHSDGVVDVQDLSAFHIDLYGG